MNEGQIGDVIQQIAVAHSDDMNLPEFSVGAKVFIRTITMYYIGEIIQVTPGFLRLGKASWVARTENFERAISIGWPYILDYSNYADEVVVSRWLIVDATRWRHHLQNKKQ